MKFAKTKIAGVFILDIEPHVDDRGYFARAWCEQEFRDNNLNPQVVQINTIVSHVKGTLRGIHYQQAPHEEAKLVRCIRGKAYDVAVDLRKDSPTYLSWYGIELKAGDGCMLYVPEGCGHGFQTLEDETEVVYQATTTFAPNAATGVRYDDPALAIDWPLSVTNISEADLSWPEIEFEQAKTPSNTEVTP